MRLLRRLWCSMSGLIDEVRLRHMLDAARDVLTFVLGKDRKSLDEDRMLVLAVVKSLEIIGEAASRISQERQSALPEIPWRQVVGMRNRLIHAYYDVDLDVVWQTIVEDLPQLIPEIERALLDSKP